MRTFKLIKDFINGSNIETDAFFRLFFLNYRADRAHPFDGSQVKFHGKYIENKKENIPYDPKIGLISYIMSCMDQLEDKKYFDSNKNYAALILKASIICWIYHFEFENELLDKAIRLKLEPSIFSIISGIEDADWQIDKHIDFFINNQILC